MLRKKIQRVSREERERGGKRWAGKVGERVEVMTPRPRVRLLTRSYSCDRASIGTWSILNVFRGFPKT